VPGSLLALLFSSPGFFFFRHFSSISSVMGSSIGMAGAADAALAGSFIDYTRDPPDRAKDFTGAIRLKITKDPWLLQLFPGFSC
jgi:hypothetical protein